MSKSKMVSNLSQMLVHLFLASLAGTSSKQPYAWAIGESFLPVDPQVEQRRGLVSTVEIAAGQSEVLVGEHEYALDDLQESLADWNTTSCHPDIEDCAAQEYQLAFKIYELEDAPPQCADEELPRSFAYYYDIAQDQCLYSFHKVDF